MKLSDIADLNPRRTLKKGTIAPFVEMASLPINARNIEYIGEKEFKSGGSKFRNDDVLFARITPCLENGKTAKVSGLADDEIAFGSTEFIVLAAKNSDDKDYLYYLARLPEFRAYAQARMEGTSGRQRVAWQSLAEFEFNFPEPEQRKKAGNLLKIFDDKIQLNNETNQTLENIAQALFKSWFIDFDPVRAKAQALTEGKTETQANQAAMQIISGKTAAELNAMQQTHPTAYAQLQTTAEAFPSGFDDAGLPLGWKVKSLDEIAHYQNGLALQKFRPEPDDDDFLPVVKIKQLKQGYSDGEEKASIHIKPECIIDNGDVVFSWSGSLVVDFWCGGKSALNQHLFKVTSENYPKWFYYLYTCHHLAEFIRIANDKAVTMGHIKREHLAQAKCAVPNFELLENAEGLAYLLNKVIENRLENSHLANMRDALLPKLLNGEIL